MVIVTNIPSVKVPEAIAPNNFGTGDDVLVYDQLAIGVDFYRHTNTARISRFLESGEGSLEERNYAMQLASEYFLRTALKVVHSNEENADIWADRFTQATVELYGEPNLEEATKLICSEYQFLGTLKDLEGVSQDHVDFLLDKYKSIIPEDPDSFDKTSEFESTESLIVISEYGRAIREKYEPIFKIVDDHEKLEFNAKDIQVVLRDVLDWLQANDDPDWGKWSVVEVEEGSLSVDSSNRLIKVPSRREPSTVLAVKGLVAHEILVHALRAKNGYNTGDNSLATGLIGYLKNEEGLGILVEEAITGDLPSKAYDRYVDIALALGSIDGVQRNRRELFQISFARQLIRRQLKGELSETDRRSLETSVWTHVDRIYRGGLGGDNDSRQAIYTKDIVYYVGYKQMVKYLTEQAALGRTADEMFEFLSQAKFDPMDDSHLERLAKAKQ